MHNAFVRTDCKYLSTQQHWHSVWVWPRVECKSAQTAISFAFTLLGVSVFLLLVSANWQHNCWGQLYYLLSSLTLTLVLRHVSTMDWMLIAKHGCCFLPICWVLVRPNWTNWVLTKEKSTRQQSCINLGNTWLLQHISPTLNIQPNGCILQISFPTFLSCRTFSFLFLLCTL